MNDNTNFKTMLNMMWDMQLPVITVEFLEEDFYGKPAHTSHIIIPNANNEVTDFMFVRTRDTDFLASVSHLKMSFEEALIYFSEKALRNQGALLKLYSN